MKLRKRKPSGREKDEASIALLEELRGKLYSDDASNARRAAFNLSWMQEDGLDILKEALFGKTGKKAKRAAAYGLRSMQGRMKKMAVEVLEKGLEGTDRNSKEVCNHALMLLRKKKQGGPRAKKRRRPAKLKIMEIPNKRGQTRQIREIGKKRQKRVKDLHFPKR